MSELTIPPRSQVPPEQTWNAGSVYATAADWEAEYKNIEAALPKLKEAQDKIDKGARELAEVLHLIEDIESRTMKLMVYASMSHSVNMQDQTAAGMYDRMQSMTGVVEGAAAFLNPGLLVIGRTKLVKWMEEGPGLKKYEHFIGNLFRKQAHVRSPEVEEIAGMLASPFSGPVSTYGALTDADLKFKPAVGSDGKETPVTQSSIDAILDGPDREARRTGWESYMDGYLAHKNTLANTLGASIKQDVLDMQIRRHESTLEASLFDNNIPAEVFHNLINVFKKNLPTWHRYWRLKRKAHSVEELHPYDIWAPLTKAKPRLEYRQVVDFIVEGMRPLGHDYVEVLRNGCLKDRWVDYAPCQGKTAGAFSAGTYGTYPFICMSFTNDVNSLSTLAHELGHSMHSYLTWKNQPFVYSNYSLFVAEVASNFHQAMVRAHLLKTQRDPELQIALLQEALSNFHRYFFIMPTLARFELEMHQWVERGEGLTADTMNNMMTELFEEGYGGEMHVDKERVGITWATFGHLYYDYYVYQYATGISAAHALSNRILEAKAGAAQDYLKFLSAGSSVYPLDALKMAGVDLRTPQAVEETFKVLEEYVERLEKLTVGK
jgi:oligoendopeptidase F